MKKFATVEDYLEVLSGYRDQNTGALTNNWFTTFEPIISLARYDVDVLNSMSETTTQNRPLTEKQGTLLCNILLKYKRQLANKSIDVSPIENPVWRIPLRKMDYTRSVTLDNDKIIIRFPFDNVLIDDVKKFRVTSQGGCSYNRDEKLWKVALTEYNINWVHTWATSNKFTIDPEIESLNNLVLETENTPYLIELRYGETQLEITNAPDSMLEYINTNLGGLSHDNLLPILDATGILGITVEPALREVVNAHWGYHTMVLAENKEARIDPMSSHSTQQFQEVLDYAVLTNRLPVIIYEPDMSRKLFKTLESKYSVNDIFEVNGQKRPDIPTDVKFIYTPTPIRNMERIPMLVTSAGMIYGGDKQLMAERSEKIVFIANEVYNTKGANKSRKIVKL